MKSLDRFLHAFFRIALALAPEDKRGWLRAMETESLASDSVRDRLGLALGALQTAMHCRLAARDGIAFFGRIGLGAALLALSLIGSLIMAAREPGGEAIILLACGFYAVGGLAAWHSLGGLRRFAAVGIAAATILASATLLPGRASAERFYLALSLEMTLLMIALLIAANLLPRLRWEPAD